MGVIKFAYYNGKVWDTARFQPNIFICDSKESPVMVPEDDGAGLISADIGVMELAALHIRWKAPSFGEVTLPTAALAPRDEPYNLNVELATARLGLMRAFIGRWKAKGYAPSDGILGSICRAEKILGYISGGEPEAVNARWGDLALSILLPAGEELALECAEWSIGCRAGQGGFAGFKFGCSFFNMPRDGAYLRHFLGLFNFATLPFYWSGFEPEPGAPGFQKVDELARLLEGHGLPLKGHPLLWFHTMPVWAEKDIGALKRQIYKRVSEIVTHYKGKIRIWDVINEIQHINPYGTEVGLELARYIADTVAEFDPGAVRIINADEPFGEYMAKKPAAGMAPYDFFEALEKAGAVYEVIGIQLYHGAGWAYCRDLFEMSRYFDRYEKFGKPVHLTELGSPSEEGYDRNDFSWTENAIFPKDMRFLVSDAGFWRGPWDQKGQADWVEGFYKILMGKPFVEAITWWDFSDQNGHFFSHSGLLDKDGNPKEAYRRLKALRNMYLDN